MTRDRPTDQLSAGQPLRSAIFPTLLMVVKAVFCFQSFFLFTPTSSFSALAISSSSPSSRRGVSVQMVSNGDGWMDGWRRYFCVFVLMKFEFFLFATFFDFAFHFTCDHRF